MIIGGPTTRILGLVVLIAAGGCGSGSGRPPVPPLVAAPTGVPSATDPLAAPLDPLIEPLPMAPPGFRRSFGVK